MASCSFTSNGRKFTLSVVEESYSIENNTSNIRWTITISGGGSTYYDSYCKATVNGSVVYNQTKGWSSGAFPAKDGSVTDTISNIPHDSVGKATISFALEGYSYVYSTQYASDSLKLTDIPRATPAPKLPGMNISDNSVNQINITPYSPQFSHSIKIKVGSYTAYLTTDSTRSTTEKIYGPGVTTFMFAPDSSFYNLFDGKYVDGSITVYTYSGSKLIGSSAGVLQLWTSQYYSSPYITGTLKDVNETTKALTGDENSIIRYKSVLELNTTIEPTYRYDKHPTLTYLSVGSTNVTDLSKRVFTINNPASKSYLVKAINSRGYSTEKPIAATGTFIEYIIPTITITSAKRTEPTTGDATIEYKGDYYNGNFSSTTSNELNVSWKYKEKGATDYTTGETLTPTIKNNTYSGTISIDGLFDYKKQYEVVITASDKLSNIQTSTSISRGFPIFWWGENFVDVLGELRVNGKNILINPYPVGSIYMSINSTDPSTLFGGTWERLKGGFLYGAVNSWGLGNGSGTSTNSHTLTVSEIPSHTHTEKLPSTWHFAFQSGSTNGYVSDSTTGSYASEPYSSSYTTGSTGGGSGHSHDVPYIAVFMWRRTA